MHIATNSVKKPVAVIMMTLAIVVLGLVSLPRLGLDLLPELDYPIVTVVTSYPGIAPEDIENLLTKPLEDSVSTVKNVKSINSTSAEGMSVVKVELEWGTNLDFATQDIREKIGQIQDRLPEDASTPLTIKFDLSSMPIIMYGVTSKTLSSVELKQWVKDNLADDLKRIEGVAQVIIMGGLEREIQVLIDKVRLESYGVSINQISNILKYENLNISGGHFEKGRVEYLIRSKGEFVDLDEIRNTVITVTTKGTPIHIKDIAEVRDTNEEIRGIVRTNKIKSVMVAINKESGANTVKTVENVRKSIPELAKKLPPETEIQLVMDQSDMILTFFGSTSQSAILGAILAALVIFLFLKNWRPTLTIALTIPLALLATFIGMTSLGYTFNMMTLGGLTLGVGMLVDNAVVVIENIFRRMEEKGEDRFTAASKGANQVIGAITASTITTIVVFVPMALAGGIASKLAQPLAFTIAIGLLASLLMAVTFVPMMASKLFKTENKKLLGTEREGKVMQRIKTFYQKVLRSVLNKKKKVLGMVAVIFLVSLALIPLIGLEFMPESDQTMMVVNLELPQGTPLSETERITNQIADQIEKEKGIKSLSTIVGVAGSQKGSAVSGGVKGVNTAQIFINLVERNKRDRTSMQVIEDIRQKFPKIPGSAIKFTDISSILLGGGGSDLEIKIYGKDLEELKQISAEIRDKIEDIPGVKELDVTFREGSPELLIKIDRDKAAQYGITAGEIGQTTQIAFLGSIITRFRKEGEETDLRLKFREEDTMHLADVENLTILSPLGVSVPLKNIAQLTYDYGPTKIFREDQSRKSSITVSVAGRDLGSVVQDVQKKLKSYQLPSGYSIEYSGTFESMQESFSSLLIALIVSVLLLYMIMAAQFESLIHPLTIIFTVPLGVIGVLWALLITRNSLSLPAMMGLVMLGGIVVNNAIVLVDFVKYLRSKGVEKVEALIQAGGTRLRPILITTITTVLGMFPLAISTKAGAEGMRPMAIAVIGGLTVATLLTLIVIPIIYIILDDLAIRIQDKIGMIIHGEEA